MGASKAVEIRRRDHVTTEVEMNGTVKTWLRGLGLTTVAIVVLGAIVVAVLTARVQLPGEERVPAGLRRNQAVYVQMRDGVQIAVDISAAAGSSCE